ncbi:MAG: hypothetical protein KKB20_29355 [Proteobacteria bacterium]|nr:hypothetical protein [Pseudomonadota bacterium]
MLHPFDFLPPVLIFGVPFNGLPDSLSEGSARFYIQKLFRFFCGGVVDIDLTWPIAYASNQIFGFPKFLQNNLGDIDDSYHFS